MKVRLEDKVEHYRTVWMNGSVVEMIDQNKLPHSFEILKLKNHKETAEAIRNMNIRGAGAIGGATGYAMAQAFLEAPESGNFYPYILDAVDHIKSRRPTAQNLFYAVDRVLGCIEGIKSFKMMKKEAVQIAEAIADEDAASCKKIGEYGRDLIKDNYKILTHCNAGWLAFVDYGSALSPIYAANNQGKNVFVWADETRPRLQGARLTAWELDQEGIDHKIIVDNVSGCLMWRDMVDMVIVGSDRIASNGDVANKIGTYEKAVLAKENKIPFYVAAPTSTIDMNCKSGKHIPIEERDENEVLYIDGFCERTNQVEEVKISSGNSHAYNYAFDVTPAKYVKGIITEKGIVKPNRKEIKKLFT